MKNKHEYFVPHNACIERETKTACKRLAKLFNSLQREINQNISATTNNVSSTTKHTLVYDIWFFTCQIRERLDKDGWKVLLNENYSYTIKEKIK